MIRRTLIGALAVATSTLATAAPLVAHTAPSFTNPTSTTTTTPEFATPTTTSTTLPDLDTETTTTTSPELANPTTTSTTTPELANPSITSTSTTSPELAQPTTPTTTEPELATPTTTIVPGPDEPLGEIDTSGAVPDGLDLSVVPGADEEAGDGGGDGPVFTDQPTCANQCIKSGLMYPRGFGAQLVVETYVKAQLTIALYTSDNDNVDSISTTIRVNKYRWAVDHLDPGETYYVAVIATDDNDDTAYAFGEFETLSRRSLTVAVGFPFFTAGPTNLDQSETYVWVNDLDPQFVHPQIPVWYYSVPRQLDLEATVFFEWNTSVFTDCDYFIPSEVPPQGDSDGLCGTWNTAATNADLDQIPEGQSRWTTVEISRTLDTSTDGVVPPDYGNPRYLGFQLIVTLTVDYS